LALFLASGALAQGNNAATLQSETRSQASGTAERPNLLSKQGNHRLKSERKRERAARSGSARLKATALARGQFWPLSLRLEVLGA